MILTKKMVEQTTIDGDAVKVIKQWDNGCAIYKSAIYNTYYYTDGLSVIFSFEMPPEGALKIFV